MGAGRFTRHFSQCSRYKLKKISNNLLTLLVSQSTARDAAAELDEALATGLTSVSEWAAEWQSPLPWQLPWRVSWPLASRLQSAWPWQ